MHPVTYRFGTALAAVVLASAVVLAGCGPSVPPASGPSATGQPQPVTRPLGERPVAGSKAEALRLLRNLIAHIALPPGSARLSGPVPRIFGPYGQPVGSIPQQAAAYGLWSSPASMDATAGFAQAHPPPGTRFVGRVVIGLPSRCRLRWTTC